MSTTPLTSELLRLRAQDPDVDQMLTAFEAADRIYQEVLEAMGINALPVTEVTNSAEVILSFPTSQLSPQSWNPPLA